MGVEVYEVTEQNFFVNPRLLCKNDILSYKVVGVNLDSETKREEKRRYDQARFARRLKMEDKRRLLGVQSTVEDSSHKKSWTPTEPGKILESGSSIQGCQEKESKIIKLTDVTILPKVGDEGGETIVGTLAAHVHGFIYMTSGFKMQFMFKDLKNSFFRLGDERMPPLVHFHFHPYSSQLDTDIEFHLVRRPLGRKKRSEKDKQIRDARRNMELKNFVDQVDARWSSQTISPCLFDEIEKEYEFYGDLPPKGFALASFHLILLVETPVVVFPLKDIEIVNLALLRPGVIDMTVIFQDFEKDNVLQINSIPLKSLTSIKERLNWGQVKYYVNTAEKYWKAIVLQQHINDFPEKFIEDGGWDYFELEDRDTFGLLQGNSICPDYDEKSLVR
ncbi:hypothetical protein MKX03_021956 [Papaver bracteatum]|nr:hypothetical protein MKX03_021956 [Papaver bracteatum]